MCRIHHEETHVVTYYDKRHYVCDKHHQNFSKYCSSCNLNICSSCENEHISHTTCQFEKDLKYLNKVKNNRNELRKTINQFNENIKGIIKKLNKLMENMESFYNIYDKMVNGFEKNKLKNNNTINNFEIINSFIEK